MGIKRHKPEGIVTKFRQVEVLVGRGKSRIDAIREIQITEQTYYRWRKQYGGMGTVQLKELKRLQKENGRLRRAVSERRVCRVLGQHRSTQRRRPRGRADEDRLVADMIELARQYGRMILFITELMTGRPSGR